jgi:secreted trypsin-like serine protease
VANAPRYAGVEHRTCTTLQKERAIMKRLTIPAVAVCLMVSACEAPATRTLAPESPHRIVYGSLAGDTHPAVVLIVIDSAGAPTYRCTGTVIKPKLVLTAGHCVGEPGEFSAFRVFTESDVQNGNNNYPYAGPNTIEATAAHAHPLFKETGFFRHDVGVIELHDPIVLPAAEYGQLPSVDQLDDLQPRRSTAFTAVGYGVQRINPAQLESQKVRMVAEPWLVQINTPYTGNFSLLLSNNASTGGTCFGDSGGPNFLGSSNVIAAVTSFGNNGWCGGTGGVFRLDRADVLEFLAPYLAQ